MTDMELKLDMVLRYRRDHRDFWRVVRLTDKSAYMARCGPEGEFGAYGPSKWLFRRATVVRDFFPA